jgi:ribulose-phosphate 3-epimerase
VRHSEAFAGAGADSITVHYEATPHVHYALQAVRGAGCAAGLALNPGTTAEVVRDLTEETDMVLCMTVNPGWGGQDFLEHSLDRLARIRALIGPDKALEVDGGIDEHTAPRCARAGATVFVAGTAVFGAPDPQAAVRAILDATAR